MTEINLAIVFTQFSQLFILVSCGCLPGLLKAGVKRFRSQPSQSVKG